MLGLRRISTLVCSTTLLLAACSRQAEQPAPPTPDTAAPVSSAATQPQSAPQSVPAQSEPPADSSLSIKRGVVMLAQDRMTFRPCNEKAELWLLDQSDGLLRQTFESEMQKGGPAMLYVEAYGERAPVADDIEEARAYAGTFVLEEVTYAAVQDQVRGCDEAAPSYIVAARGSEPSWGVEVGDASIVWRQPLLVDAQTCRDSMSGELFAYSARAVLDGKEFSGCARVGK
jgi:hypothetical protein